jgi:hypothetical protein
MHFRSGARWRTMRFRCRGVRPHLSSLLDKNLPLFSGLGGSLHHPMLHLPRQAAGAAVGRGRELAGSHFARRHCRGRCLHAPLPYPLSQRGRSRGRDRYSAHQDWSQERFSHDVTEQCKHRRHRHSPQFGMRASLDEPCQFYPARSGRTPGLEVACCADWGTCVWPGRQTPREQPMGVLSR